ncbi:MAG TPA: sulfite exporter TauE/SafE family protein [Burkholderiales bacterium]|jgi:uncharacterized membrane protein YfcA|nr:sulfite exporter TauE/SafE family protein [Burkholderiales bacterium]
MDWWPAYLAIGVAVGFLAGLLGIGGGAIMVPMLVFVFTAKGFAAEHLMHQSIATALATIVFTSLSSVRTHHRYGAVEWPVVGAMAPGIVAGSFGAALLAGLLPTRPLMAGFALFMLYTGTQMFFDVRPRPGRQLPRPAGLFAAGSVIGALSSLFAVGGAFLSIPFLSWCNLPLKRAIGTAAANGFPIAVAGSLGYIAQGLRAEGLPAGSLGYVYLPALGFIVVTSMLTAPLGARLVHRAPVRPIRMAFSLLLYALAIQMLVKLW